MPAEDRAENRRSDRAVYVISVAAELAGVHPQTLRIYERKGLVDPSRTGGGSRRYSDDDVAQLRRIQELTADGLNLAGVKKVVEMEAELDRLRAQLDAARAEAEVVRRRAEDAVDAAHRQHRRDLVPVHQAVVLYEGGRRRRS
ncbi:MAG: helix-turn-helix transcriptional regulator [Acidimicrobiia bacterium]|nr:helix-turn-helix transcriptional regulator [Acidimicrobiia bacterium]